METQKSNEETKHDILQRMQSETHEIIGELSAEEYERRKYKRAEISNGCMWYIDPLRKRMSQFKVADGTRCIMEDCYGLNRFDYFTNNPELEKKIFGKEFTSVNNPNI